MHHPRPGRPDHQLNLYNGDDAVVLRKNGVVIDAIGQVGFDPGAEWGTGLVSTVDNTLRRISTVCQGDPIASDAFDPALQWDGFAQDTVSGLGAHSADCPDEPVFIINEVNSDQESLDAAEFIELYDGGGGNSSLDGLALVLFNGSTTTSPMRLMTWIATLPPLAAISSCAGVPHSCPTATSTPLQFQFPPKRCRRCSAVHGRRDQLSNRHPDHHHQPARCPRLRHR